MLRSIPASALAVLIVAFVGGCASTAAVRVNDDTVYCPILKANVTKPADWEFVGSREIRETQRAARTTNATLNYLLYQDGVIPSVSIVRRERYVSDHGASLAIYQEPLGEDRMASSDKVLGFLVWAHAQVLTGARQIGPTINVQIGGKTYAYGKIFYTVRFKDGSQCTLERHFWVRALSSAAIVITAACDIQDSVPATVAFQQIVHSIVPTEPPRSL